MSIDIEEARRRLLERRSDEDRWIDAFLAAVPEEKRTDADRDRARAAWPAVKAVLDARKEREEATP